MINSGDLLEELELRLFPRLIIFLASVWRLRSIYLIWNNIFLREYFWIKKHDNKIVIFVIWFFLHGKTRESQGKCSDYEEKKREGEWVSGASKCPINAIFYVTKSIRKGSSKEINSGCFGGGKGVISHEIFDWGDKAWLLRNFLYEGLRETERVSVLPRFN